jgi:hypothetical protein
VHFSIAVNTVATGHVRVGISRRPRLAHDHHRQERRAIRSTNHISEQPLQRLQVGSRKVAHDTHDKPCSMMLKTGMSTDALMGPAPRQPSTMASP